jgi:hypothetical protein
VAQPLGASSRMSPSSALVEGTSEPIASEMSSLVKAQGLEPAVRKSCTASARSASLHVPAAHAWRAGGPRPTAGGAQCGCGGARAVWQGKACRASRSSCAVPPLRLDACSAPDGIAASCSRHAPGSGLSCWVT